jgi:sterol desaturase/sphingolipid hydroxylase (fatty acid hydroxylase superfamily)
VDEIGRAVAAQFLLFTALLTPLELLWPGRAQARLRRGLWVDLAHFCLSPFAVATGASLLLALIAAGLRALMPVSLAASLAAQPWSLQLAEILVISELLAYGAHVAAHRVPLLWRFHAVHHSAVELDWLAAHRQHPIESIWLLGLANLPAIALGFSTEPLIGFVLFQKVYTAFLHANVRITLGPLGRVLACPRFHRWHHDGDDRRGRNFAGLFSFLDVCFGTYALPPGEPARFGTDEPVPEGYLAQLAYPLRRR